MWRGQIEPMAELGRVIVFDGPGHGKSEPAPRFMLEDHADALFDAFGELGIRRAIVIGLSWGGMTAMRLALQHPEVVSGLGLLDTSAEVDSLVERAKYRAFIAVHRRTGFPLSFFKRQIAPLMFSPTIVAENARLVEETYRRTMGFDRNGVARASLAVVVHRKTVLPDIGRIHTPTLVMCGREDRSTPVARSEAIAKAIPNAGLVVLDGLGHMAPLEDSKAVNRHLIPFVVECLEQASVDGQPARAPVQG
jgi:3-oxoadipate enol-lactonase